MLKKLRAYLGHHRQAAMQSLHLLGRTPFATTMTVVVIAITLALPTLLGLLTNNIEQLSQSWRRNGHISLYLQLGLTEKEQALMLQKVRAIDDVGQATLKTPEQGLAQLQAQEGMQDVMSSLAENPLPAVIEIIPALHVDTPLQMQQLHHQVKNLPQVELAKLDMQWINRLHALLGFASDAVRGLMVLLSLAVLLIISNTLRLAIHNRQEEIQVLKLIGATDPYITRPFLYSGIWYGLSGAAVTLMLVNLFMLSLANAAKQLANTYQMDLPLPGFSLSQCFFLLAISALLGWLAACLSVKRQLASIEPYK